MECGKESDGGCMTQTSSVVTGGVTVTAATLVPYVNWALHGFQQPIPDGAPYLIAAALVTAGHLIYNVLKAKGIANESLEVQTPKELQT